MNRMTPKHIAKRTRAQILRKRLDRHKLKFRKWAQELAAIELQLKAEDRNAKEQ
jgi:hypothetical protein